MPFTSDLPRLWQSVKLHRRIIAIVILILAALALALYVAGGFIWWFSAAAIVVGALIAILIWPVWRTRMAMSNGYKSQ